MNAIVRFTPVAEINDPLPLSIGISGTSGTGKTYSALLMARGIAKVVGGGKDNRIGYVDTENRRALHYKSAFPEMVHFDMKAADESGKIIGFGPERWIEVIDAAEKENLPVLVIDSFSHAWEGVGGVLDLHAETLDRLTGGNEAQRNSRSQLAWAHVKPLYRRLIDRIVRAKTNIIICTRAKPVMQDVKSKRNARPTKTRRADVPWDPAADGDLLFEMTTMVILDPVAPGCPVHQIKVADQVKNLFDSRTPLGEGTGEAMARWSVEQGRGQDAKETMDNARAIARTGSAAFTAWWQSDEGRSARNIVRPILDELRELAQIADTQDAELDDAPFKASEPKQEPEGKADNPFAAKLALILQEVENAGPDHLKDVIAHYAHDLDAMKAEAPELYAQAAEALGMETA